MITEIETAVAVYLRDKFEADETLAADTWTVKPASSVTAAPKGGKSLIVVAAASVPQTWPQLKEAMIHIHVMTPAEPAEVAAMATLFEKAVARAFDPIDTPTVEADLGEKITERLPDWSSGGIHVTGWQPGRDAANFTPHFELKAGLVRT